MDYGHILRPGTPTPFYGFLDLFDNKLDFFSYTEYMQKDYCIHNLFLNG